MGTEPFYFNQGVAFEVHSIQLLIRQSSIFRYVYTIQNGGDCFIQLMVLKRDRLVTRRKRGGRVSSAKLFEWQGQHRICSPGSAAAEVLHREHTEIVIRAAFAVLNH